MNMFNALQVKKIRVSQELREQMRLKFLDSYNNWELNKYNKFIGLSQAFHDYINYLSAELQVSPRAFYYLDDIFGERRHNNIDILKDSMTLLYLSMSGALMGNFYTVKDESFGKLIPYKRETANSFCNHAVNMSKFLYGENYEKIIADIHNLRLSGASVHYAIYSIEPYLAELIYFGYATVERANSVVNSLSKITGILSYDAILVLTVLLITKNEAYLELGLTLPELVDVCESIFVTSPKLKAHWNELILCKFFEYPDIHIKLMSWLCSDGEYEEPTGI